VIVDVGGVGYDVAVSLNTLESLPHNGEVFLHTYTVLRENALELYGFHGLEEKTLFEMLIGVTGIGPKMSLVVFSGISPDGFRTAVLSKDLHKLMTIPGIGRKSAERIVLELHDKVRKTAPQAVSASGSTGKESIEQDLVSSLVNLGYKDRVAAAAAKKVLEDAGTDLMLPHAVKMALKELMK